MASFKRPRHIVMQVAHLLRPPFKKRVIERQQGAVAEGRQPLAKFVFEPVGLVSPNGCEHCRGHDESGRTRVRGSHKGRFLIPQECCEG
eukprot:4445100-Prymnesium_polylepis.3